MTSYPIVGKPGEAVIHCDLGRAEEALQRSADLHHIFDLCALVEAAIIYPRLHLPLYAKGPLVDALTSEGILQQYDAVDIGNSHAARNTMPHPPWQKLYSSRFLGRDVLQGVFSLSVVDQLMSLTFESHIEPAAGIPFIHSPRSEPLFTMLPAVRAEARAAKALQTSLAHVSGQLRRLMLAERGDLDAPDAIPISPIAADVFHRCRSREELAERTLQVRRQFSGLRERLADVDRSLRSPDVPLRAKAKQKASLTRMFRSLFGRRVRSNATISFSFANEANDIVSLDDLRDGADWGDLSYGKLAGLLLSRAETSYWRLRLRPLHRVRKRYLDLSKTALGAAIRPFLGRDLTAADLRSTSEYYRDARATAQQIAKSYPEYTIFRDAT